MQATRASWLSIGRRAGRRRRRRAVTEESEHRAWRNGTGGCAVTAACSRLYLSSTPGPSLSSAPAALPIDRIETAASRRDHRAHRRGAGTLAATCRSTDPPIFSSVSLYAAERIAATWPRWCPAVVRRNFHFWAVRTYGLDAGSEILGARVYLPSPARIPSHSLGTDKPRAASLCSSFPREGKGSNRYYLRLLPASREGKFFDVHRPFRKVYVAVDQIRFSFLNFEILNVTTTSSLPIPLLQFPI